MTDQKLLKMARSRDDGSFGLRVAAAMTLHAQEVAEYVLDPAPRALTDWVLSHPMEQLPRMVAFVATNASVQSNVTLIDGAIDTSAVPDADIEYVVGDRWDVVARLEYPQP